MPSWVKLKLFPLCDLASLLPYHHGDKLDPQTWSSITTLLSPSSSEGFSPGCNESQRAATLLGVGIPVVVQRVYSLPCRCQPGSGWAAPPGSDPPGVWWVTRHRHGHLELLKESRGSSGSSFLGAFPIYMGCFCLFLSCIKIWDHSVTKESTSVYL